MERDRRRSTRWRTRRPHGLAGRAGRDHGPERVGQEHAAHHRRDARGADERSRCSSTGSDVSAMSRNDRARLRRRSIGYVFQDFNLLRRAHRGRERRRCRSSSTALARRRRALPRSRRSTSSVSPTGPTVTPTSCQAVSGSGSRSPAPIVGDRRLLLADEPTGALDSVNGESVMRLVRAACKRGVAGVLVTHDAQLASWADRVVFLRDGRVVDQSAPAAGPESLLSQTSGR